MFGKNKQQPVLNDSRNLFINSIFYTIQGEGPYSGMPALFIRLAGCNLACVWCDTEFDQGLEKSVEIDALIATLLAYPVNQRRFVVITGGEPLRQNITYLCELLLSSGTELIQVETAGTVWQAGLDRMIEAGRLVIVCSPKTPGINPHVMRACHHWKYIIRHGELSPDDGLPMMGTQPGNLGKAMRLYRPWGSIRPVTPGASRDVIWVSPCDDHDSATNRLNVEATKQSAMTYGYRVSLQTHKILGVE